jgi:hypothetical protein
MKRLGIMNIAVLRKAVFFMNIAVLREVVFMNITERSKAVFYEYCSNERGGFVL